MSNEGIPVHAGPRDNHMWHHNEPTKPTINVSAEKNSRGTNWSATVMGAASVKEAIALLLEARNELEHNFGNASEVR